MLSQYIYFLASIPFKIFEEITFDVYILSDKTKKNTYITSSDIDMYFVKRICDEDVTITKIKSIYAWELKKFVDQQDAVLIDMHKLFARFFDDGLLIPKFVSQVLDIDQSVDQIIKINNKNLKRVRKYRYEIMNDLEAFKFFYEKMYTSHIKRKYGDSAVEEFSVLEKIFRHGELVFVKHKDEYVSAQLSEIKGNVYFLRKNGVLDESSLKAGSLVALYYFSILRAKERNVNIIDFGRSRPFLYDGVLRHKNVWGTRICNNKTSKRIIYLRNFLFEQPFIYIEDKKLKAAVFSENEQLKKEYSKSGLELIKYPEIIIKKS